jgi:glyoxylase-like metal-dependent hydrolase (beta-lactamase superfamily II)
MKIPLEDNHHDILGKARRGLKLSDIELAQRAGVSAAEVRAAFDGGADEIVIRRLARPLGLGADALAASARKAWSPRDPGPIHGLACFNTPYEDLTVNSYLVYDSATREAAAFDTGADCGGMLEYASAHQLKIVLILLTHIHADHILDLARLKKITAAPVRVSRREPMSGTEPFPDGQTFRVGGLTFETRRTSGHARGGTTYVVTGLKTRLAVVGDALFAGSMGGGVVDYREALRTNRENILTLPEDTVLCPGHGPLTTVGEEKKHNPFFAS